MAKSPSVALLEETRAKSKTACFSYRRLSETVGDLDYVSREPIKKIMKNKAPDYSVRSGELADRADWVKAVKNLGSFMTPKEGEKLLGEG